MSKVQKTIKLNKETHDAAEKWIEQTHGAFNFSSLMEAAVRKYISEPQELEPVTLDKGKALQLAKKAMKKHKKALDRMK